MSKTYRKGNEWTASGKDDSGDMWELVYAETWIVLNVQEDDLGVQHGYTPSQARELAAALMAAADYVEANQ